MFARKQFFFARANQGANALRSVSNFKHQVPIDTSAFSAGSEWLGRQRLEEAVSPDVSLTLLTAKIHQVNRCDHVIDKDDQISVTSRKGDLPH